MSVMVGKKEYIHFDQKKVIVIVSKCVFVCGSRVSVASK